MLVYLEGQFIDEATLEMLKEEIPDLKYRVIDDIDGHKIIIINREEPQEGIVNEMRFEIRESLCDDIHYKDEDIWEEEKEPYYNKPIKQLKNQVQNRQQVNAPIPGRNY